MSLFPVPEPGYINVTQSNGKALLVWTYSGGLPADDVTAHHRISNGKLSKPFNNGL